MLNKLKDVAEKKGFLSIPVINQNNEDNPDLRCQIEFQKGHKMVIEGSSVIHNLPLVIQTLASV